jgi:ferredoxin
MKVRIDASACQGHGLCVMACPEVFHFDDEGHSFVESEDVPPGVEAAVKRAERQCPERAVHVAA